jgi:NAD dependent epimerase/dehydratase
LKKLLVTGAGGFIGSHLVEALVQQGYEVKALVHYNSRNDWGWLEKSQYRDEIEVVTGDIRDYDCVSKAVRDRNGIFHLAALIGIPYSYVSPLAYIQTNVIGSYNVLEAAKENNIEKVIITSTSEVYGTAQSVPITETHPLNPQSPYAASKVSADQMALSYYRSFNTPVVLCRPFNTYGPRQSARAVIPSLISQALSGREEIRTGNLKPTRDFNYVLDTVAGFIELYNTKDLEGQVFNIATQNEISMSELLQKILALTGRKLKIIEDVSRIRPEKSEVMRLLGSNEKVLSSTAWKPRYSLDQGLSQTIEWLGKNLSGYKTDRYNI